LLKGKKYLKERRNNMRKLIGIVVAVIVVASMAAPVFATDITVDVLGPTGGDPPIIKCKWEFPDDYPGGANPGTQVDPPLVWEANKPIKYFAVVTDLQGKDNINKVYTDVYHPQGPPENGSFKYQLLMSVQDKQDPVNGIDAFEKAVADETIVLEGSYSVEEIREELTQCSAEIYMATGDLYYEQPAGDYKVIIKAVDDQANVTTLENTMVYVATSGIELDFTSINYGSISVCDNQLVDGDKVWVSPAVAAGIGQTNMATIRNTGNTLTKVTISIGDLMQGGVGLGKTDGQWNVQYDARMGHVEAHQLFWPEDTVTLNEVIELSSYEKLDVSMHVTKAGTSGTWTSTMTLGSVVVPFQ
jgi:hypothetical protein